MFWFYAFYYFIIFCNEYAIINLSFIVFQWMSTTELSQCNSESGYTDGKVQIHFLFGFSKLVNMFIMISVWNLKKNWF